MDVEKCCQMCKLIILIFDSSDFYKASSLSAIILIMVIIFDSSAH